METGFEQLFELGNEKAKEVLGQIVNEGAAEHHYTDEQIKDIRERMEGMFESYKTQIGEDSEREEMIQEANRLRFRNEAVGVVKRIREMNKTHSFIPKP